MATQPTKGKGAWEDNEKDESIWEEAVKTVRKRDKEQLGRKEKEEHENKMAERALCKGSIRNTYGARRRRMRRSRPNGTIYGGKNSRRTGYLLK
jgi:hypothetical protein